MMTSQKILNDQTGSFNYVSAILILLVVGIGVASYIYAPPVYQSFTLGHFIEGQAIKATELSDSVIHENISKEAERLGIDTGTLEVELNRYENKMMVSYTFERRVGLPGLSGKPIKFSNKVERNYSDIIHLEDDTQVKKYN